MSLEFDVHLIRMMTLETGAKSSSMAEAMSRFFQELDPLRDLLCSVLEGWRPPRIVVVGDESAGKSTILEQLANVPIFPRKRRFCTRMAICLRLRRTPGLSKATLFISSDMDGVNPSEGGVMEIPQENGWRFVQDQMEKLARGLHHGIVENKFLVVTTIHMCD